MVDMPPSNDTEDADDLVRQAEAMRLDAAALNDTIIGQMESDAERSKGERRRLLAVVIVLAVLVGALVYRSIFVTGPIITKLDAQQKDLTSLVEFVEQVWADDDGNDDGGAAQVYVDILCATEDPVRRAHCETIGAYDP